MLFRGPGNSGKTFFMLALAQLFILVGQIKNLQGGGTFRFQDITNVRVIFLDELTLPNEYVNDFKEICAGQSMHVNKKFKDMQETRPVPVILLTNNPNLCDLI